jgi:pyrimidine operon attenuation protein/uracil phosphoribosyltransferase
MQSASLSEIRKELKSLSREDVINLCNTLIKYKRDNKELLNYLLFETQNEDAYVARIKEEVSEVFAGTNTRGFYLAKKSIRRALRIANKYIKYSDVAETELDVLLHFCEEMRELTLDFKRSKVMTNLYERQVVKIIDIYSDLHEDLQFDFRLRIEALN